MFRFLAVFIAVILTGCTGPPRDTTAPSISNIHAGDITGTAAIITWVTDEAADSQVEYGTTAGYGAVTPPVTERGTAHSQILTGLKPGAPYHYRVLSRDAAGNLATSLDNTFTTAPEVSRPPSPPEAPPASELPARSPTAPAPPAAASVPALSPPANVAKPVPADTAPPLISGVTAGRISNSGAVLRWTTNEPADTQIEYGTTTAYGTSTPMIASLVMTHSQNLEGLLPSTVYHYRVKGRDAAGNLAVSSGGTFRTEAAPDTAAPSVPAGLTTAVISYSQINVAWNASTDNVGVTGYRIYRNGAEVAAPRGQIYTDSNLVPDTAYRYRVAAVDAAGNLSAQSVAISVRTPPFLSGIDAGRITQTGATITWTTPEPASAQVEYGTTTEYGLRSALESAPATAHSVALSELSASTLYHYRVISRDAAGNEVLSSDQSFTTADPPDRVAPSVPEGLTATASSSSQVSLTWTVSTDNRGVAGYRVYRNGKPAGTTVSPSYSDTGLTASTSYSYSVSAYDAAGNESAQSAASAVSTPRRSWFGGR
ncbi:MAG: hypothetical protein EPO39_18740 [Candidatus Manganitrophaceae bacterium]|nr:MAG: hypothetical protein EPO39_18740 [Candidatus Manganitrophaceae bacterium]